jgi:hypothetical protein
LWPVARTARLAQDDEFADFLLRVHDVRTRLEDRPLGVARHHRGYR